MITLAIISAFAALILAANPLGPCSHSILQWICLMIIYIPLIIIIELFGEPSTGNAALYIIAAGISQSLMFSLVYLFICLSDKRNSSQRP